MKLRTISATLGLLLLAGPSTVPAQPPPPGGPPQWKNKGMFSDAGLDREEAQRLAAAREKAKNDPTVRSLKEARDAVEKQLESAMRAAMLAADPGLAPTLEKVSQSRDRAKGMRDRFESLTPEQREQLKAAREKAKDDPEVAAAREKMKSAGSREERREAGKAMHEAMKAAMLKENPDLAPVLEQLGPPPGGPGGRGGRGGPGGPDGPMGPPPGE